ncbi:MULTISPECIES: bis(5'-nucleosyl)-tetraphosphatase (symmetrical) YqeK [Thermus]|uniref:bis(5'-nucleosyl)-tetraphosphatase (symmetrical) n=1 Tax=Thermus scotoductus TaxID=37636 RepID=A0A430R1F2_THESC|nr:MULTISPECIES: bis(5'-nucleosyl)-tetraphosphatase (symmetrical) YqeK [Thermus]RTG91536.1 phosphohydrolase [Thermus scotoductus]RTH01250.1 phosphohydrolase [Thermus scotoductus]RTH08093.1 phosphohydrolase [Thermus scotoductus]RTH28591.1 phosphohydrolase [Thermus scotoductus]
MKSTVSTAELEERVKALVRPERWAHIQRVAALAQEIALKNGLDGERAYLAGLLHDAARDLGEEELLRLAPPENEVERAHPLSLHGRAARVLAEAWGVKDEEVLEAVEGHVYGVDPQNGLGMALYIADISEPGRGVNGEIRELALSGRLLEAYRRAVQNKVEYLTAKGIPLHPKTLAVYRRLQDAP